MPTKSGQIGDLQAAHDRTRVVRDHQEVARVGVDRRERPLVGLVDHGEVARLAKHVVGEQSDDRRQVGS